MSESARFFVTGMPRSRTAWLANLFNFGPARCLHDGLKAGSLQGMLAELRELEAPGVGFVGDSDCGLGFFWERLVSQFPRAPWVVIRRPVGDAQESYRKHFSGRSYKSGLRMVSEPQELPALFEAFANRLEGLVSRIPRELVRVVEFEDLDSEGVCKELWTHCVPSEPFDAPRFRTLSGIGMNMVPEKISLRC